MHIWTAAVIYAVTIERQNIDSLLIEFHFHNSVPFINLFIFDVIFAIQFEFSSIFIAFKTHKIINSKISQAF